MNIEEQIAVLIAGITSDQQYEASVDATEGQIVVKDPHGEGATLEIDCLDDTHIGITIGRASLIEVESSDTAGLLSDIDEIVRKVLTGELTEVLWVRQGDVIAARLVGLGYSVTRSRLLVPRWLGSKSTIAYSPYRRA